MIYPSPVAFHLLNGNDAFGAVVRWRKGTGQNGVGSILFLQCLLAAPVIEKILAHLDQKEASTEASRLPPCRAPPQAGLFD
jgi:hypothetical protein